ncbi:MAG: Gfo/Idh/MocA family oxidoreductase [Clostridium sp.]
MKVCFVGLGSIGKRHLKNLVSVTKELGIETEIHALRNAKSELPAEINSLVNKQIFCNEDLDDEYDIAFITNPTSLHFDVIKLFEQRAKNMFIEKPIFETSKKSLTDLNLHKDGVYYIAAPMRYTDVMTELKKIIKDEKVYSVRNICSTYLPDWRPSIDYRDNYSAKKNLGGGVSLDCIHEWDYLVDLFGFPEQVFNFQGKYSHLEIDSDDLSVYIAQYKDKLVELHLDYIGRESKREIELYTKSGTIVGDFINYQVRFTDGRETITFENDDDEIYIRELKHFLNLVVNKEHNDNDIEHAYRVLQLAEGEW